MEDQEISNSDKEQTVLKIKQTLIKTAVLNRFYLGTQMIEKGLGNISSALSEKIFNELKELDTQLLILKEKSQIIIDGSKPPDSFINGE